VQPKVLPLMVDVVVASAMCYCVVIFLLFAADYFNAVVVVAITDDIIDV
jgi:hypothetical protein